MVAYNGLWRSRMNKITGNCIIPFIRVSQFNRYHNHTQVGSNRCSRSTDDLKYQDRIRREIQLGFIDMQNKWHNLLPGLIVTCIFAGVV